MQSRPTTQPWLAELPEATLCMSRASGVTPECIWGDKHTANKIHVILG